MIREREKIISFFHTRLSIIDLSERSAQPMTKQYATLIFNGEIYNYLEIKNFLETKGYKFKTSSDTEVLLSSYLHWGEECVKKFNGMWSFLESGIKKEKNFFYLEIDLVKNLCTIIQMAQNSFLHQKLEHLEN